ncbi:MAG: response regulator, partial [Actinomycetota bacterium]|nr:response regulator [Actinomycetota bacterium]
VTMGLRVLVVDDDSDIGSVLKMRLELEDEIEEVQVASSAPQALNLCLEFVPQVVVVDRFMPGRLSGEQFARALRDVVDPAPLIIAFTGFETEADWYDVQVPKGSEDAVGEVVRAVMGDTP